MKNQSRTILLWAFIALLVLMAFVVSGNQEAMRRVEMPYSELMARVGEGDVQSLQIQGSEISGTLYDGTEFKTNGPQEHDFLIRTLSESGIVPDFTPEAEQSWFMLLLLNGLPIFLILLFFLFMMRQLQMGGGKAMSFGKSKARLLSESRPDARRHRRLGEVLSTVERPVADELLRSDAWSTLRENGLLFV